ncbi:hypothetical protein CRYPA_505 [uncultured Candidatus Thioglobus sp.]|nr:hypothetical protein CRYPA_505 [uncultured Candidatus Thioglobus sp.]
MQEIEEKLGWILGFKAELDSVSSDKSLNKAFMIEEALSHYFHALKEIPSEMILPKRMPLSEKGSSN